MVDIIHRVGVASATPDDVFRALTTIDGLAGWWTRDTTGDPRPGGTIQFRFPAGGFDMEVAEAEPATRVVWDVVGGPDEWIGTTVRWDLSQQDGHAIVSFVHADWAEPVAFMGHCSTKWATYLMSLKSLLETGTGAPAPDDVHISDWD